MDAENRVETGLTFVIGGTEYPAPSINSFDMAERRLLFELSGIVQEDFARSEGETDDDRDARVSKMMRHPGFMEAMMSVAYQRGNPDVKNGKVAQVIGRTNYLEAMSKWAGEETAVEGPPAQG